MTFDADIWHDSSAGVLDSKVQGHRRKMSLFRLKVKLENPVLAM